MLAAGAAVIAAALGVVSFGAAGCWNAEVVSDVSAATGTFPLANVEFPFSAGLVTEFAFELAAMAEFSGLLPPVEDGFDCCAGSALAIALSVPVPCNTLKRTIPITPIATTAPATPTIVFHGTPLV